MVHKSPGTYTALLVLCVLGLVVYGNAIPHPFLHDDLVYIRWNPFIARWDNILEVFIDPQLPFGRLQTPYYRPMLEVLYRLEFLIFGMNAWGFHLVNVLLHSINAWLVYLCARRLRLARGWAFLVGVIFQVHPLQTEAVACISGISNLAVTALMLWAFLVYLQARCRGPVVVWRAIGLCTVAFFAKEQALVFAGVIFLYEVLYRRESAAVRFRAIWPFAAVTGIFMAWRAYLFPGFVASIWSTPQELWGRLLLVPHNILTYFGMVFWPQGLHYYRSLDVAVVAPWGGLLLTGAVLGLMPFIMEDWPAYARRGALFGIGLAVVMLVPGLNIVPLINEHTLILTAEHFFYCSLFGVLFAVATAVSLRSRVQNVPRSTLFLSGAVLVIVLGVLTIRQNMFWKNEVVLFERTLVFEPGLGRVHMLLAKAYADERRFVDAVRAYTEALRIMENYVKRTPAVLLPGRIPAQDVYRQFVKAIHDDRARCRLVIGDLEGAAADYRISVAMALERVSAEAMGGNNSASANNLGLVLLRMGDRSGARRAFMLALRFDPRHVQAMNNLGMMAIERRDPVSARFWFRRAVKIAPEFVPALKNLERVR